MTQREPTHSGHFKTATCAHKSGDLYAVEGVRFLRYIPPGNPAEKGTPQDAGQEFISNFTTTISRKRRGESYTRITNNNKAGDSQQNHRLYLDTSEQLKPNPF